MRAMPRRLCDRSMQHGSVNSRRLRVLIIDDHAVYRAACRALLQTEGLEVVADLAAGEQAIAAVGSLRPDIAIVDISPGNGPAIEIARRLRVLPGTAKVVLTSSTDRSAFDEEVHGFEFIAKADICAERICLQGT